MSVEIRWTIVKVSQEACLCVFTDQEFQAMVERANSPLGPMPMEEFRELIASRDQSGVGVYYGSEIPLDGDSWRDVTTPSRPTVGVPVIAPEVDQRQVDLDFVLEAAEQWCQELTSYVIPALGDADAAVSAEQLERTEAAILRLRRGM